jgi:hypothetical protein
MLNLQLSLRILQNQIKKIKITRDLGEFIAHGNNYLFKEWEA